MQGVAAGFCPVEKPAGAGGLKPDQGTDIKVQIIEKLCSEQELEPICRKDTVCGAACRTEGWRVVQASLFPLLG